MAALVYGAGLRLIECLRLRLQDVDFSRNDITICDDKSGKDRMTMLPASLLVDRREEPIVSQITSPSWGGGVALSV